MRPPLDPPESCRTMPEATTATPDATSATLDATSATRFSAPREPRTGFFADVRFADVLRPLRAFAPRADFVRPRLLFVALDRALFRDVDFRLAAFAAEVFLPLLLLLLFVLVFFRAAISTSRSRQICCIKTLFAASLQLRPEVYRGDGDQVMLCRGGTATAGPSVHTSVRGMPCFSIFMTACA